VYDLTEFADRHPGGALALQHAAGQQVGDLFAEYHPSSTYLMLPTLQIGQLALDCRPPVSELARDRRELRQRLLSEGLFESRPLYFIGVAARALAFCAAAVALLCAANGRGAEWATTLRFFAAVSFGLFFQQMAFIGHDSGHSGVTHSRYRDSVIGLFTGNFFSGISMAWWKVRPWPLLSSPPLFSFHVPCVLSHAPFDVHRLFVFVLWPFLETRRVTYLPPQYSHNVHHIVCNSIEHDPDIQHLPFFAISPAILTAPPPPARAGTSSVDAAMEPSTLTNGPAVAQELRRRATTAVAQQPTLLPALVPPPPPTAVAASAKSATKQDGSAAAAAAPSLWQWSPLYYSSIHRRWLGLDMLTRTTLSVQHWVYYPLMALARFNLYAQSWILLIADKGRPRWRAAEMGMLVAHLAWHGALLAYALPTWQTRLAFLLVSHAVAGVLHVQITLSHFAMQVYHGHRLNKFEDWCTTQLMTTMNVDSDWRTDWFFGGLQFQIEHHLFPRVPRHNLRRVSELVRPFCAKHNLPYVSVSFARGNLMVLQALKEASQVAWTAEALDIGHSMLADGLHARG
jgi:fatty acid desaturase